MLLGDVELFWSLGSEQPPSKLAAAEHKQTKHATRDEWDLKAGLPQ